MLLTRAGLVRPPLVYVAIGLPERLARLRSARMRAPLRRRARLAARRSSRTASTRPRRSGAGSASGADARSSSSRSGSTPTRSGRPTRGRRRRRLGRRRSAPRLRAAARGRARAARGELPSSSRPPTRARRSAALPANVSVETDLPFDEMRERLERARVVALPVRENSYSGATTVLLQAMALEKPVVVTRTSAIATGYGLVDGENCRLVAPGDEAAFARPLRDVLGDDCARARSARCARDRRARAHVGPVRRPARGARPIAAAAERSVAPRPEMCPRAARWIGVGALALVLGLVLVLFAASRRRERPRRLPQRRRRGCSTATSSTRRSSTTRIRSSSTPTPAALWVGGWRGRSSSTRLWLAARGRRPSRCCSESSALRAQPSSRASSSIRSP